jgi:hypothetical protein
MDTPDRRRQHAGAREREQCSRTAEHIARDVSEHRHDGAKEHEQPAALAQCPSRRLGERRGRKGRHRIAEQSLRHHLNQQVQGRRNREGGKESTRHGARRIAHLAARDERDFESNEREDQDDRGLPDRGGRGHAGPAQVGGVDHPHAAGDQSEQREKLGDRHDLDHANAWRDAAHVDGRECREQRRNQDGARRWSRSRLPQCAHRPGKGARDRCDREGGHQEIQHSGEEADEWSECSVHVGVDAARQRDATAGCREAADDERHQPGAYEVGDRRRGAKPG